MFGFHQLTAISIGFIEIIETHFIEIIMDTTQKDVGMKGGRKLQNKNKKIKIHAVSFGRHFFVEI